MDAADHAALDQVVGDPRPGRLIAASRHFHLETAAHRLRTHGTLRRPEAAAAYLVARIGFAPVETVLLLLLDHERRLLREIVLSSGSRREALVPLREIARHIANSPARAAILGHNHPSGDPGPSRADQALTRQVADLAATLDVVLDDHIIVANQSWRSFRADGLL